MNREIPGYYYDQEKKKYFRIENSKTAPAQAAWSSGNVKRRRVESAEDQERRARLAKIADATAVKRAEKVWGAPLMGGCFLGREILGMRDGSGNVGGVGAGLLGGGGIEDMRSESWTMGLRNKGDVDMGRGWVSMMYIGGQELGDGRGLGVGYAVLGHSDLMSAYIPRDDHDEINYGHATIKHGRTDFRPNPENAPFITTALGYHAPTHKMIFSSWSDRSADAKIHYLTPGVSVNNREGEPAWSLGGDSSRFHSVSLNEPNVCRRGIRIVNTLTLAPASSRLTCVAGTDRGILKLQGDDLRWLTYVPMVAKLGPHPPFESSVGQPRPRGGVRRAGGSSEGERLHGEIFSLDFLSQNTAEVVLAGGRSRDICLIDMRCPEQEWMASYIRHPSSVAHVRSVGDYGVLAAGPTNAMAIYDVRFNRWHRNDGVSNSPARNDNQPERRGSNTSRGAWGYGRGGGFHGRENKNNYTPENPLLPPPTPRPTLVITSTQPIVTFPEYRNKGHLLGIGLDVLDHYKSGGPGLVAAAHDDGTVGMYSLRSGRRLRSPALEEIGRSLGRGKSPPSTRIPIVKTVQFQTLPGDVHPSLFVPQSTAVKKYSFGMSYSRRNGVGPLVEDED